MFQGYIDLDAATPVEASAIPDVLFERGLYWASGRSGVVNLVAAHKWFNLAAVKGRVDAIPMRREVAELTCDVEIATAQREARTRMTAQQSCDRSTARGRRGGRSAQGWRARQHFLAFLPLPQGQGSLRPTCRNGFLIGSRGRSYNPKISSPEGFSAPKNSSSSTSSA